MVLLVNVDKFREIVENPLFEQDLSRLGFDAVRADEFTDGCKFVLARNPEYGTLVGRNVWFLPMWQPDKGKRVNLYYTFDHDHVYFLSLQRASEDAPE